MKMYCGITHAIRLCLFSKASEGLQAACRWHEEIPSRLKNLVERCWDDDYDKRPDFDEICDVLEEEAGGLGGSKMIKRPPGSQAAAPATAAAQKSSTGCCSVM